MTLLLTLLGFALGVVATVAITVGVTLRATDWIENRRDPRRITQRRAGT